jgi:hypothetical protein
VEADEIFFMRFSAVNACAQRRGKSDVALVIPWRIRQVEPKLLRQAIEGIS